MHIQLYASNIGPASPLGIPSDPTPSGTSVQQAAAGGNRRIDHPITTAPSALRSFGAGINISTSA